MNLNKYAAFFHDGSIIDIVHRGKNIEFSMSSAEMDAEDNEDGIILSEDDSIQGKLHVEGVKNIAVDDIPYLGILKKEYDSAGIFDLEVSGTTIEISVKWSNYRPRPNVDDFSTIKIEAEKIYWENIPNLET